MLSLEYIQSENRKNAKAAAKAKKVPFVFEKEDVGIDQFKYIPNLGDYQPKGWTKVEDLFVDSTGWGAAGEPAMTIRDFQSYVQQHLGYGYAIVEAGEMQLYIGVFKRD